MNIQRAYLWALLGTPVAIFFIPYAESISYEFEMVAVVLAGASAVGIILSVILAGFAFREVTLRTVRIAAFWAFALPFILMGAISLFGKEPNVHGVSFPAFAFYALISAASAPVFVIVAEFKKS